MSCMFLKIEQDEPVIHVNILIYTNWWLVGWLMVLNQGSCKSNKQTITTTTNPVRIKGKPYIETSILYLPKKNPLQRSCRNREGTSWILKSIEFQSNSFKIISFDILSRFWQLTHQCIFNTSYRRYFEVQYLSYVPTNQDTVLKH